MKHLDTIPLAVVFLAAFGGSILIGSAILAGAVAYKVVSAGPIVIKQHVFPH